MLGKVYSEEINGLPRSQSMLATEAGLLLRVFNATISLVFYHPTENSCPLLGEMKRYSCPMLRETGAKFWVHK